MTTPQEARAIADMLQTDIPISAVNAFRSLADQVEALTAENAQIRELMNMYNLGGWTDSLTLIQERDSYKAELSNIANANPMNWDAPHNDTATFQIWAQSRARFAIAKGTAA